MNSLPTSLISEWNYGIITTSISSSGWRLVSLSSAGCLGINSCQPSLLSTKGSVASFIPIFIKLRLGHGIQCRLVQHLWMRPSQVWQSWMLSASFLLLVCRPQWHNHITGWNEALSATIAPGFDGPFTIWVARHCCRQRHCLWGIITVDPSLCQPVRAARRCVLPSLYQPVLYHYL